MFSISQCKRMFLGLTATLALGVGSLGIAASASAAPALKALPQAPQASSTLSAPVNSKPQTASPNTVRPAVPWTVSLTASPQILWPDQYSTLTATTNQNVGPTPYYLSIYDQTAGTYVADCATGTTCTASATYATATTHTYVAYVSYYPSTHPPTGIQASATTYVEWHGVSISLKASPTTLGIGGTTTLTSTTSSDIGPSPFYAEIYDATTGARVGYCGFGTSCSVTTSQAVATTHKFVAFVSLYSTAYLPTGIQATSNNSYATWANTGYRLSLSAARTSYDHDTLTATSNVNVLPTPYYIEIFNENTGVRVGYCGSGTSCAANVALGYGTTNFVAFTSSSSTALPPLNTQASSNVVSDTFFPIPIARQ